jgi:hypothetical protein
LNKSLGLKYYNFEIHPLLTNSSYNLRWWFMILIVCFGKKILFDSHMHKKKKKIYEQRMIFNEITRSNAIERKRKKSPIIKSSANDIMNIPRSNNIILYIYRTCD